MKGENFDNNILRFVYLRRHRLMFERGERSSKTIYDTNGQAEEKEMQEQVTEIMKLGSGKQMDRYDQTPRQIRCITRGFRFEDAENWNRYMEMRDAMLAGGTEAIFGMKGEDAARRLDVYLETIMEEPEAEQLEIGKLYTVRQINPDIGFGQGLVSIKEIRVADEFYDELNYTCEDGLPMDPGFHCSLFEELHEVSIEDRIRHRDEYWASVNKDMEI